MADSTEGTVASIWGQILGVENPLPEASFYELGGTSLMAVQIAARLAETLDIDIKSTDVLRDHELRALIRTVRAKLAR